MANSKRPRSLLTTGRPARRAARRGKQRINPFLILLVIFTVWWLFFSLSPEPGSLGEERPITEILTLIDNAEVESVELRDSIVVANLKSGEAISAQKEGDDFLRLLAEAGIDYRKVPSGIKKVPILPWADLLFDILPIGLTIAFFYMILKQSRMATSDLFSFGRSKAKLFVKDRKDKNQVTFKDVAGSEEAKRELLEVVDFLKRPKKYHKLGARIPKGVLLIGPPGVGKTLMARAVANEAGVPFFSMAGSEFMEALVGIGASVTGDTPVLVRTPEETRLIPIAEFVDRYYQGDREGFMVPVEDVETLGFEKQTGRFRSKSDRMMVFSHSAWKGVRGVYRHRVDEIYEIEFLGGTVRVTGDHSLFVRQHGGIRSIKAKNLKVGDLLVDLPLNTREWNYQQRRTDHHLKAHVFSKEVDLELDFWGDDPALQEDYEFALAQRGQLAQGEIAEQIGVCQMTVSNWQRGVHLPRSLSKEVVVLDLPQTVKVTPELMKLFGYYTAEGRGTGSLEFTFGSHENTYIKEVTELVGRVFGLDFPTLEKTISNTTRIKYYSAHLGRFFTRYCGNGSHHKHAPSFIWDLPREYFLAYLEGYVNGDGYITKEGKVSACSVSQRLIRELAWLCNLHGIGVGVRRDVSKAGRTIRADSKPLPETVSWKLIISKTSNPFLEGEVKRPFQVKRAKVRNVTKRPYRGYVYDLCGCENEAFFGGEKPILLHNSRVRDLFSTAKKASPSLIFIDEIESIGHHRGVGFTGGHGEREQTLNQILVEMDGFDQRTSTIILAASNRPDLLDPALLRPGRFDRRVSLELPDISEREAIIKIHMRGKPFDESVRFDRLAKQTVGFSGADIENMLNEAAILAARVDHTKITAKDLSDAATKVKLGPERKRLQSEEEKKVAAYHEAGHALVSVKLPGMDPVQRVSIVARTLTLGHTEFAPKQERYNETKKRLTGMIATALGGRAAEELVFDELTVGASNDISQATELARRMVVEFGMSDLGPIDYSTRPEMMWLAAQTGKSVGVSEAMAAKIDEEVKKIVDSAHQEARKVLKDNRPTLDKIATKLLKVETLEAEEFEKLIK